MTLSTIDFTKRLDDLERQLPPLPAKSMAFGRAAVRHTNDIVTSVVSDVARRMDRVVSTARSSANTTGGQARSAVERTAKMGETSAKQTIGQARSVAERTAKVAQDGVKATAGQARSGAERTSKVARTTAKETAGQARTQAARTADATAAAAGDLIDDATQAVDPDASPQGLAYEDWTKSDLYERAQELDIDGRSTMSKKQLIRALRSA